MKNWQEVVKSVRQAKDIQMEYWLNETLFSSTWWILLIVTLVSLVVWIIIVDKKRLFQMITYGFIVEIIAITSDKMGVLLEIWRYKHTLSPLTTTVEIHIILMPIIYMLIYQYFNTWKSFLMATTINAFIFAFILEPILVWLDVYELISYKHFYSFLPYIIIAVFCKFIVDKLKKTYG